MAPTIGRQVRYHADGEFGDKDGGPYGLVAFVVAVHSEHNVNLCVFDSDGVSCGRQCVPFIGMDEEAPRHGCWCEWPAEMRTSSIPEEVMAAWDNTQPAPEECEARQSTSPPDAFGGEDAEGT